MRLRRALFSQDRQAIAELLEVTGFFNPEEVGVALELGDDCLARGEKSHYRFQVVERQGRLLGFSCWGPIPGTRFAADLYWIAVHPANQREGVGRALLLEAEAWMAEEGRTRVYVETSSRPQYSPTRAFYEACGYRVAAQLPDFYAPGDGKVIYFKDLQAVTRARKSLASKRLDISPGTGVHIPAKPREAHLPGLGGQLTSGSQSAQAGDLPGRQRYSWPRELPP